MRIPIAAVRRLGQQYELSHVIVFGMEPNRLGTFKQHVATWGRGLEECGQAADFGNKLKVHLGWPERLTDAQPSRVRRLQAEVKRLKEKVADLEAYIASKGRPA